METSTNHVIVMDQSASTITLVVKQNQNLIVDLDFSKYPEVVQPFIMCLNHSVLRKALVYYEQVPLSALILAYSTASYNKSTYVKSFEIQGKKTAISKASFCKLLGLPVGEGYSNPEHVSYANIL
ncbi:unnamed protein product [Lactuca saligna]|uniref:Uncharacterized protein n=1 Tax=Lactuca saligna TaxID=75948 RepID=A0AA36EGY9_LACSI|nr:unnamed protein product [Lactuca saligna]